MKAGELLLLDTNVLLTATSEDRRDHKLALDLFRLAPATGIHLAVCGQVIREYLVVSTRPAESNGLGLATSDAIRNAMLFRKRTLFLEESEEVTDRLLELVSTTGVSGKGIHEANLVALMRTHHVSTILTGNTSDFAPFKEITAIALSESGSLFSTDAD